MNSYYATAWRPAQVQLAPAHRPAPALSQAMTNPPPGTMIVPVKPAFIDSPLVQLISSTTAAVSSGMLGYSFGKANSRWSTVFWAVSAITGFVALINLTKLNR